MSTSTPDHPMGDVLVEPGQPVPQHQQPNGTPDILMKEEPETSSSLAAATVPPTVTPQHSQQSQSQSQMSPAARGSPARGTPAPPPPSQPIPHGSPTRVYLNTNVTPHLLEGMKYLAAYEPEKPLKWLAEFLAEKSKQIEGP